MADEIRVVPEGAEVEDPEVARAQIAHTRARMSGTIDEIEDVLLRRKEKIQNKLDPFSAVRDRPLQSAGIVFGAGLVLGLLTGGDDDDDDLELGYDLDDYDYDIDVDLEFDGAASRPSRTRRWKNRARETLHMEPHSQAYVAAGYEADAWDDEEWADDDSDFGAFSGLHDAIADRLGPVLRNAARHFLGGNRSS
jgi:ElaB/YqjD/DUF883 family membrane-anchored ribosome-binding protein